ncbi:WD40 repeat-like protein [Wallemia mellicola CBS 633.66]|uniref:WD40 repeat-like protein n=1 Tax=Wallemia mellicola (strain ATCC MYA-4683 / CBS 633.66) TaxID=671144 RepID=I4YCA0_WALMC|nr:WD40 repeat-like protein [Wallemia mellicola CBS 633.66]EIM21592.1 WD40 repeat-like protein [Wallemia mellicola CBS 633.66]|eukprot:XP_006958289.1 WD40 repeat-like protein [Wallemia mellicola CBS 633.66]
MHLPFLSSFHELIIVKYPFANDRPETLEHTLDAGATCIAYNRGGKYTGALLASGRFDGFVNVWDMLTLAPLRVFEGHVKAVSTVSWSKNSRFLLSASRDWNCIVWDMETSERAATIKFDAPIQEAFFHPFTSKFILVTLSTQQTFLVDLTTSKHVKTEIGQLWEEDDEGNTIQRSQMTTARFSTDGQYIFGGTAQGRVIVFELPSLNVVSETGVCNGAIKQISISNSDRLLACTSRDRTVRVAQVSEDKDVQPVFRFVDEIDKTQWNAVCFSNDNEYIIGGSGHKATHYIYIWESTSGALIKVVEGPRDPLHDVIWHPSKPNMASIDSHGQILTWTTNNKQRWAAFAPGFEELEANIQYKEKEDEFDIYVDQDNKPVKEPLEEGLIDIDTIPEEFRVQEVVTPEFIETHFKDEEDNDINFFPSPPDLSDVEDEE